MSGIIDSVKKVAENEFKKMLTTELGVVTSVFPHSEEGDNDNYECNVKLKDKNLELRQVPMMTQHIGLANPLHVGDLVLVTFINGDINAPVILGRIYNDEDRPPLSKQEEVIYKPPYAKDASLKRLNIVLPGKEDNVNIEVHDDMVTTRVGKTTLQLKEAGMIEMRTESDQKCIIILDKNGLRIDTDGDILIHSAGSTTIGCGKDLILEADNISIKAQSDLKIVTGMKLELESGSNLAIKSPAAVTVQGSVVKVN
jgi:uncharacterized protein involved in type VI secretion and phage assembly